MTYTFVRCLGRKSSDLGQTPGITSACSMTILSIWPQMRPRLVVSVSASAWSISLSTSGSLMPRLVLPLAARMTRLSTICAACRSRRASQRPSS